MDDDQLSKIYLIAYLGLFVVLQTGLVYFGSELESPRGIINTAFTYLAFVPLFGYTHKKQIPTRGLWRLFIIIFFLWQIASFSFLYPLSFSVKLMQILMLLPLYWSLAGYALITVQKDESKKAVIIQKRDDFMERSKSFVVIIGALAMLFLLLCLFTMIRNYLRVQQMM